jgi:formylglycine-generating enzyme required for sulfatase activity
MIHLLKSSTLTFIAVVLGISMVYDVIGQPILEKKKVMQQENQAIEYAMVHVTGGCYDKGDTFGDGQSDERPVRTVCVDDFDIGKYEVTQGQWLAIMKKSPSTFGKCGEDCPVEEVSWDDVQEFITKLNKMTGRNYRLPTGDEWEYAARSGGKHEKWSGTSNWRLCLVQWQFRQYRASGRSEKTEWPRHLRHERECLGVGAGYI